MRTFTEMADSMHKCIQLIKGEEKKIKGDSDIKEFLEQGYTLDEIEKMSDDEFVYTAVMLVDGKKKEEIDKDLKK